VFTDAEHEKIMEMTRAQRHLPELDPGEQARELAEQLYVETGNRVRSLARRRAERA
jgi:hypothetical protein